ncbi:MAG: deoxyhypusine synthase family protein [Deltaproteobacteria bacterium]|nr:deoxyhypusine synthase family protein [Deltaproteobacteria bacterium]
MGDHDDKTEGQGAKTGQQLLAAADTKKGPRDTAEFLDGESLGLEACAPIDLSRCRSFSDLLEQMKATAFGGRQLGEAADVLEAMVRDEDCLVVGTFSGAMTVAKQGLILCDMIDHGMVDIVISTGALMAHGLIEATGMRHYKASPDLDDRQMYYLGFDRVYDTLELEKNLDDLEVIFKGLLAEWPDGEVASSHQLCERLGRHLQTRDDGRGILRSATEHDVPVYVPAFTDSELGLDFALYNRRRAQRGEAAIRFDPFLDLEDYTERVERAKRIGIFTIGGGVPRNWAQQVCPYIDLIATRQGATGKLHRFRYGVRICPEPVHWGGLSGCTYSEGVSWGKFVPPAEGGRYAEVAADATVVWPLLVAGVLERLKNEGRS